MIGGAFVNSRGLGRSLIFVRPHYLVVEPLKVPEFPLMIPAAMAAGNLVRPLSTSRVRQAKS